MRISRRFVGAVCGAMAATVVASAGTVAPDAVAAPDALLTIAFVPKLQVPYFDAMNAGALQAATDLGNIEWLYRAPESADPAEQAQIVSSLIDQKVDALVIAPNDPETMAPLIAQAEAAGIRVLTADTDAPSSDRDAFVSQATAVAVGNATAEALMEAMGGKGKWAIVSCGETAENLNSWIAVEKAYVAQKYPAAELVDVVYSGEDQAVGTQLASELMSAHPDLVGLVGQCTTSAPGVAQAVADAGRIGEVFTVGIGTPNSMKPHLADGSSSAAILWNVHNLGYLTAWAAEKLSVGEPFAAINDVNNDLSGVEWDQTTKTLVLGEPLLVTTANVDQFNY